MAPQPAQDTGTLGCALPALHALFGESHRNSLAAVVCACSAGPSPHERPRATRDAPGAAHDAARWSADGEAAAAEPRVAGGRPRACPSSSRRSCGCGSVCPCRWSLPTRSSRSKTHGRYRRSPQCTQPMGHHGTGTAPERRARPGRLKQPSPRALGGSCVPDDPGRPRRPPHRSAGPPQRASGSAVTTGGTGCRRASAVTTAIVAYRSDDDLHRRLPRLLNERVGEVGGAQLDEPCPAEARRDHRGRR